MTRLMNMFILNLLLGLTSAAAAAEYSDPAGFSFTYPSDWTPVAKPGGKISTATLPPAVQNWIRQNQSAMDHVNMSLLHAGGEFMENLNVVVQPDEIPVKQSSIDHLLTTLPEQYRAMGGTTENMQGRIQNFGANKAIVIEYRVRFPVVAHQLMQRQVMFPGGGQSFIVTCTAKADGFAAIAPTFDGILASFKLPAPTSQGFDWNSVLGKAIEGGIIGGAIGGIIAIGKMLKKKKPTSPPSGG